MPGGTPRRWAISVWVRPSRCCNRTTSRFGRQVGDGPANLPYLVHGLCGVRQSNYSGLGVELVETFVRASGLAAMQVDRHPASDGGQPEANISRVGSKLWALRHARTKVCWVASSARSRSPSTLHATANTRRPYSLYTARTAVGFAGRKPAHVLLSQHAPTVPAVRGQHARTLSIGGSRVRRARSCTSQVPPNSSTPHRLPPEWVPRRSRLRRPEPARRPAPRHQTQTAPPTYPRAPVDGTYADVTDGVRQTGRAKPIGEAGAGPGG